MTVLVDELAGIVDLFGGLTRAELDRALEEAAFRADGQSVDSAAVDTAIETAVDQFALLRFDPGATDDVTVNRESPGGGDNFVDGSNLQTDPSDGPYLVAGPTAFPKVPEYADDLPHILDVTPRSFDRDALGRTAADRFTAAVDAALTTESADRIRELIEVSYDIEAWAPVDLQPDRQRLDRVRTDTTRQQE